MTKYLLKKAQGLGIEFLNMMFRGLAFKVLFENIDDVVGFDAFLSLISQLLDRFWELRLFSFSFELFLNHIFVGEVNTGCPTTLCMGLDFVVYADPICVHLKCLNLTKI